jgi:hypothetical protein
VLSGDEIFYPKRNSSKKMFNGMSVTAGDKHPSYYTAKSWVAGLSALKMKSVPGDQLT